MQAQVPADLETEEIFINSERQILARYPDFNPSAKYFDGYAADAISTERASRWATPAGGYFHAMHPSLWGDFTWRITGKDANGDVIKEGGWQNNRGGAIHKEIYADLAARNAPIGSGSMESACGQFQDRLKRRGQFWSPRGLAHMLAIDVAVKNDTLQFLWN